MFINEYVSKEDVKKYNVDEMWADMRPVTNREKKVDPDFPYTWTVDKERLSFFIPARSGKEETSNQIWCIFWWQETRLTIVLRKYGYLPDRDGKWGVRWELEEILKPEGSTIENDTIFPVLEEALVAFGYSGVQSQYDDYIVECDFNGGHKNGYYRAGS